MLLFAHRRILFVIVPTSVGVYHHRHHHHHHYGPYPWWLKVARTALCGVEHAMEDGSDGGAPIGSSPVCESGERWAGTAVRMLCQRFSQEPLLMRAALRRASATAAKRLGEIRFYQVLEVDYTTAYKT